MRPLLLLLALLPSISLGEASPFSGLNAPAPATAPPPTDPFAPVGQLVEKRGFCSAILLTPYVGLTAGHCLWGRSPGTLSFTLERNPFWGEQTPLAKLREIKIAPLYGRGPLEGISKHPITVHDLALFFLESTNYGKPPTAFLPLTSDPQLFAGHTLSAPGYGVNENRSHGQFRIADVVIRRFLALPDAVGRLLPSALILGESLPGGPSVCHGDSGGPLLNLHQGKKEIVAVISAGSHKKDSKRPNNCVDTTLLLFTNVVPHREWILKQLHWLPTESAAENLGIKEENGTWRTPAKAQGWELKNSVK